jgi:hypothetical protein
MNKDILRHLFNTSLYLDVIQIDVKRSERSSKGISGIQKIDYNDNYHLSPQSRELLSYFSPETQKRLARDFYLDELSINKYLEKQEIDDPNYIYYNASGVGTYLELWVCVNIPCPGCRHKLYKYANPNMPVVDVRCINPNHNEKYGPIYYQIKATQKGAVYAGYKYFSYDEEYISTGSVKYGYNCHIIRVDDITSRDLLVGYICVEYIYTDPTFNKIIIDMNNSFVLIPNLQFQPTIYQKDLTYYEYLSTSVPIIKFNNIMVNKYRFSELYQSFGTIPLSNYYDARKIYTEEPPDSLMFQYKYLVMKKKYLDLKKEKENRKQ